MSGNVPRYVRVRAVVKKFMQALKLLYVDRSKFAFFPEKSVKDGGSSNDFGAVLNRMGLYHSRRSRSNSFQVRRMS